MAIQAHSAEQPIKAGAVGGIAFGAAQSLFVAGDITSEANVDSVIDTANGKLHSAEKTFGGRAKAGFHQIDNYLASATSGTSITNITALTPSRGHMLLY